METGGGTSTETVAAALSSCGIRVLRDEPLRQHTTWRIGGPAAVFAEATTEQQLAQACRIAADARQPVRILGAGSNILAADAGVPGVTVRLRGALAAWTIAGEQLTAGAGAMSGTLLHAAVEQGLSGLECLAGVPGTLGGALAGNAGAGGAIGDVVESVSVLAVDGTATVLSRQECAFGYRSSTLAGRIILRSTLCLKKAQKNDIVSAVQNAILRRSQIQPYGTWNAGSVFKNPPGGHAGRLIEACGLKGATAGGAQISEKHANFIINTGNATAADVEALITRVQGAVREQFGIALELEVKRWA